VDGGWRRIDPLSGWLAWVDDEEKFVRWTGLAWSDIGATLTTLQGLGLLGIGTVADTDNPFAAKLNKALWTARYAAEGGDGSLRYTLNKETAANTLSLLMQTGWSGRAEIGLVGSDDLAIKVSPDGSTWKEAVRFDRSSGMARFPSNPALAALSGLTGSNGAFVRFTGAGTATMQPILGSVTESAGVPTGALMERGANANGSYERYASGLAICQMRVTYDTTVNGTQAYTLPGSMIASVGLATGGPTNNNASELTAWKAADPTVHLVGPSSINIRSQTGGGTVTNVGVQSSLSGDGSDAYRLFSAAARRNAGAFQIRRGADRQRNRARFFRPAGRRDAAGRGDRQRMDRRAGRADRRRDASHGAVAAPTESRTGSRLCCTGHRDCGRPDPGAGRSTSRKRGGMSMPNIDWSKMATADAKVAAANRDRTAALKNAVQLHVDDVARTRSYTDGFACASYVASTVAAWAAEAQAFVLWRDTVWTYAYSELGKMQSGRREWPVVETFIAELPAFTWRS
jgi:hypothetical protein